MKKLTEWWHSCTRNYDLQLIGLALFTLVLFIGCMLLK